MKSVGKIVFECSSLLPVIAGAVRFFKFALKECPSPLIIWPMSENKNSKNEPANPASSDIFPIDEHDTDVMVTLDLDDGSTMDCEILTIFDIGEQNYIVLLPVDENDIPYDYNNVVIYRYFEDENGSPYLDNIQTDEEYKAVEKRFSEIQDQLEKS